MSKLATLFTMVVLLSFGLISSRTFNGDSSLHQHVDVAARIAELDDPNESCEGEEGKEECLMRRTLAAHVDYIYTQKHKPRN